MCVCFSLFFSFFAMGGKGAVDIYVDNDLGATWLKGDQARPFGDTWPNQQFRVTWPISSAWVNLVMVEVLSCAVSPPSSRHLTFNVTRTSILLHNNYAVGGHSKHTRRARD